MQLFGESHCYGRMILLWGRTFFCGEAEVAPHRSMFSHIRETVTESSPIINILSEAPSLLMQVGRSADFRSQPNLVEQHQMPVVQPVNQCS